MTIKHRISKLESMLGGKSNKHYLLVCGQHGETKQAAIDRCLRECGISPNDVGYMWLWGNNFCGTIDYKNYLLFPATLVKRLAPYYTPSPNRLATKKQNIANPLLS